MKRRLKLTITNIRRATALEKKTVFQMFCPVCLCRVEMLTTAEAAALLETEKLDELINAGKVHAVVTASGSRRVCKKSLIQ